MARARRRPANDAAYKRYKNEGRFVKNARRKLEKYVKDNPNDKLAAERLEKGIFNYRRKKPKNPIYSTTAAKLAGKDRSWHELQRLIKYHARLNKFTKRPEEGRIDSNKKILEEYYKKMRKKNAR